MYDGAIGARNMHKLQNYGNGAPAYDGNACSVASTYHDGQLKMYATHPAPPARRRGNPRYYTTQLRAFAITDTSDSFRSGAAAYCNACEWSRHHVRTFNGSLASSPCNLAFTSINCSDIVIQYSTNEFHVNFPNSWLCHPKTNTCIAQHHLIS